MSTTDRASLQAEWKSEYWSQEVAPGAVLQHREISWMEPDVVRVEDHTCM